jgi:hypothetical protein
VAHSRNGSSGQVESKNFCGPRQPMGSFFAKRGDFLINEFLLSGVKCDNFRRKYLDTVVDKPLFM